MKLKFICALAFSCMAITHALADRTFAGAIRFRGKVDGEKFINSKFSIKGFEEGFMIVGEQNKSKFALRTEAQVLDDAVLSKNQNAVAISLRKSDRLGDSHAVLATVTAAGNILIYDYKKQRMTEPFGWLIELGAVSEDGKMILAKCAKYLPEANGIQVVNHQWAILEIGAGDLKVLEVADLEVLFSKWFEK